MYRTAAARQSFHRTVLNLPQVGKLESGPRHLILRRVSVSAQCTVGPCPARPPGATTVTVPNDRVTPHSRAAAAGRRSEPGYRETVTVAAGPAAVAAIRAPSLGLPSCDSDSETVRRSVAHRH